jgi:hypothetical protein
MTIGSGISQAGEIVILAIPTTPAYCHDLDAAPLRRALAEADRSRIAEYRAEREAQIRRDIAAQTTSGSVRQ